MPEFDTYISALLLFRQKIKFHPKAVPDGPERKYRYSSIISLTSALNGSGWSTPRPGRFIPWKENRNPFYWRLGGSQGRYGRVRCLGTVMNLYLSRNFKGRVAQNVIYGQKASSVVC